MRKRNSLLKQSAITMINIRDHSMDLTSKDKMVQSLNEQGIIIDVSPGWLSITGYEREDVIGHFFGEFLMDESISKTKVEFPHLKDYGFVDNVCLKVKRKDGVVMEVTLNATSKYNSQGEFEKTYCELRTLSYYMKSIDAVNQLLAHEKFLKMIMYLKANIAFMLLLKEEENDYYDILDEILNEPPEIIQAVIEPSDGKLEEIDENKKDILISAKKYAQKNMKPKDRAVIIENGNELYSMIVKINDDSMVSKKRILVIDFNSPKELLNEWKEKFVNISRIIQSVINALKTNEDNKKLMLELKRLSETDRLTSIYNRMMIDKMLLEHIECYKNRKERFSIIMADIDYFKRVNDTYGHNAGDKVLCHLVRIIESNISSTDVVGRWGGEEFIIICSNRDLNNAMELAEKIRKKVEECLFPEVKTLTASFGVSEFNNNDTAEHLVAKADEALYRAKAEGRNRVRS